VALPLVEPADAAGVAAELKRANGEGLAVTIRGAGTKQSWGAPAPHTDVVLSTLGLNAPVDHVAGDLVATAPAGASLDAVNDVLRRERQWLPLDPPASDLATIGGIVATNDSGPRRHRYGTPRDLIIGIEIALADGRIAHAGGRVVKNVAGYDLSKLLCGSLGSLAVITSATFKLAPLPQSSSTLVASVGDARSLGALALAIAGSPLTPTAIELQSPPHRLLIRFETSPNATEVQIAAAASLCTAHGTATGTLTGQEEVDTWRAHEHGMRGGMSNDTATIVKLAVLPTDVGEMLSRAEAAAVAQRIQYAATGRAAAGIIFVRLDGGLSAQAAVVSELRREAIARRGSAVLVSAPPELCARLGAWGPGADTAPLMRAVKAQFDPRALLNRGREPWEAGRS
jgi:glycolate oxidase FAD binding subunit